jgi:hypothetical protein
LNTAHFIADFSGTYFSFAFQAVSGITSVKETIPEDIPYNIVMFNKIAKHETTPTVKAKFILLFLFQFLFQI